MQKKLTKTPYRREAKGERREAKGERRELVADVEQMLH